MIKIFVCAANSALAEQTVRALKTSGAENAEVLVNLNIPLRQPKENRYIFIFETPEEKISELVPKDLSESEYAQALSDWFESQDLLVATATVQKKRSIVVTAAQLSNKNTLFKTIKEKWALSLNVEDTKEPSVSNVEPLLAYLVQNLVEQTQQLQFLQSQIESLAGKDNERLHETEALGGYRGKIKTLEALQSQNKKLATTQSEINNQLKDLKEKNQHLLYQLNNVQEELERSYSESNKLKKLAEELTSARDAQTKAASDKKTQVELLTKEKADLTAAQNAQTKTIGDMQKQIELLCHEKKVLQANKKSLENDSLILDAQLKDTAEENDLLLTQLHQAQEELKKYVLKCHDLQMQKELLKKRWQDILKQFPNKIFAYKSVTVMPIDASKSESDHPLQWEFEGLESATVSKKYVKFETFIESGVLGVRFHKNDKNNESVTLLRWPAIAKEVNIIECIPAGHGDKKKLRASILRDMSASDWQLLVLIPKLVTQVLNAKPDLCSTNINVIKSATKLDEQLSRLPRKLRVDDIVLKKYQINASYEHLWFELNNMTLGQSHWAKFEIRFGASNVRPGFLTHHPRIEIPLIDGTTKPFESWFEESKDEFGPKWELRFDLKKDIFDVGIWNDLQGEEQMLIRSVIVLLTQNLAQMLKKTKVDNSVQHLWESTFLKCAQKIISV